MCLETSSASSFFFFFPLPSFSGLDFPREIRATSVEIVRQFGEIRFVWMVRIPISGEAGYEPDRPIQKFILPADLPAYLYHFLEYFIGQSRHLPDTDIPDLSKVWYEHWFSFHLDSYEPPLRLKRLFTIIFRYKLVPLTYEVSKHTFHCSNNSNPTTQDM